MGWKGQDLETERLRQSAVLNGAGGCDLVVVLNGVASTHRMDGESPAVIGRDQECTLVVPDQSISRRHIRVTFADGLPWIEDLGSSNGTTVDGRTLEPGDRHALVPSHTVRFGRASLLWSAAKPADMPLPDRFVFHGDETLALREMCRKVAPTELRVLIAGETGTGKEVFAETIHRWSGRRGEFIRLNCAALSPSLLESELFGHLKGAFTGATSAKEGLLEAAAGGTILLDEIGDMPIALQPKLLRTLENGTAMRVGSTRSYSVDVRFIAATNVDLHSAIERGEFRKDLYYRLNGITLRLPPLRERRGDIVPLARSFLRGSVAQSLSEDAEHKLLQHTWPGNVRELKQAIERAAVLSGSTRVDSEHIVLDSPVHRAPEPEVDSERAQIERALLANGGNQTQAAIQLGMSRSTLVRRIAAYGLARPKKR
ncbi:MAG: sigma 54-interacting transcriptional regulator [Myxococcota bacterium]